MIFNIYKPQIHPYSDHFWLVCFFFSLIDSKAEIFWFLLPRSPSGVLDI